MLGLRKIFPKSIAHLCLVDKHTYQENILNFSGCYKEIYPNSLLPPCPILMSVWYS